MVNKKTHFVASVLIGFSLCLSFIEITLAQNAPVAQQSQATSSESPVATPSGSISSIVQQVGEGTALPSLSAGHANQSYQSGASQITSTIYYLLDFLKYILGSIAVIMMVISGVKLVLSGRQVADVMNKEKETLRYAFLGLLFILVSDQVIKVFFGAEGEIFRTGSDMQMAAKAGVTLAQGVTNLLRIFIPTLAILYIIIAAFQILISRGDTGKYDKAKKQITWAVLGLVVAGLAEIIVYKVVYPATGTTIPDTQEFSRLIVQLTNFISGFISTVAAIMIIYAGYLYVISMGGPNLDKAKTILRGAIIGLLIAMAAFAMVNTFIRLDPIANTPPVQTIPIPNP